MSKGKHSEAEIIGALKQLEAGRTAEDVGREMGVAGLEEFLERKTFAVPALGAS